MRAEMFLPEIGLVPLEEVILGLGRAVERGYDGAYVQEIDDAIVFMLAWYPGVDS